jgi:hypothetical protein
VAKVELMQVASCLLGKGDEKKRKREISPTPQPEADDDFLTKIQEMKRSRVSSSVDNNNCCCCVKLVLPLDGDTEKGLAPASSGSLEGGERG